ncbi:GtrA family protein [Duganella sp. Leaf126]|uniref:GtrA family protein n=1 Tax=Duganella sp. Leaf126 TaxID=1736266 RepID=UPI001E2B9A91|nr:GtrA family protein [Duganella sp. Leaf126]
MPPALAQFLRFTLVGASGTAVQYLSLWIGVERFGADAAIASGTGYVLGSVVNYVLNYFFTFASRAPQWRAASRYFALLGVGWCWNALLMLALVHGAGWHYWPAQLLASAVVLLWNFCGSRWWAFRAGT